MKKLLQLLSSALIVSGPASMTINCSSQPDWNVIPVPPAILPIQVTGFESVDFKSMNINDYSTVESLFSAIKNQLSNSLWKDETATSWSAKKNGGSVNIKTEDLKRNATYIFEIKSNISAPGDAIFTITISSSHHIADNLKVTNIGKLDDARPRTILIGSIFNNMNLIANVNELADDFLSHMEIHMDGEIVVDKPVNGTAILTAPATSSYFYGSVKVSFTVVAKNPPVKPTDINVITNKKDLGEITDNRHYTVMMWFITYNFATQLNKLSELINDLDVKDQTDNSAIISAIPGSLYFTNQVNISFTLKK